MPDLTHIEPERQRTVKDIEEHRVNWIGTGEYLSLIDDLQRAREAANVIALKTPDIDDGWYEKAQIHLVLTVAEVRICQAALRAADATPGEQTPTKNPAGQGGVGAG